MTYTCLDAKQLYELFCGGYKNLQKNEKMVDALNVFPVPDGDTGSNMVRTLSGGITAAVQGETVGQMMQAFSKGALFSARGNSGVILSQFIHGFADGAARVRELTPAGFIQAMEDGVRCAYKAVITPVEGTILTVMRETAEYLSQRAEGLENFEALFAVAIPAIKRSLEATPEKLAVLKEAGVVDSGGAGFLCIFEGMQAVVLGKDIGQLEDTFDTTVREEMPIRKLDGGQLEYGYCTEFVLQLLPEKPAAADFSLQQLIGYLESVGDSVVAVQDEDVVKVHVHTFIPEKVLAYAHTYGEFLTTKIENMSLQHSEISKGTAPAMPKQHKQFAVVATASGDGIREYFLSIGADVIVSGGQTANPSAEDFIQAFDSLDAEHIIVLPNNGNVIMAAELAAQLYEKTDVRVLKTHSIAEGYSALSMLDPYAQTVDAFLDAMGEGLDRVTTGYVTVATRDTTMNGVCVCQGDYIGLDGDAILTAQKDKITAVLAMLEALPNMNGKETIIVFCGRDVTPEETETLEQALSQKYPFFDVGFIYGGQAVYSFILSIE